MEVLRSVSLWIFAVGCGLTAGAHGLRHYETEVPTVNGLQSLDLLDGDKQIFTVGNGDRDGSIMVVDNSRSVLAWYNSLDDECYLAGGVDDRIPNARELQDIVEREAMDELLDVFGQLSYEKADNRRVRDPTVLPRELLPLCWGKPVYWLQKQIKREQDALIELKGLRRETRGGRKCCDICFWCKDK